MTSDDQQFLDLLASIPQDVAHYSGRLADYIEKHTNAIASDIRHALDNAKWIPDSMRPPRAPTHHFFARPPPPPQGIVDRTCAFISKNRTAIAIVVAFAGTTFFLIQRRKKAHARKRRAKKFANGSKKEILVLACSSFSDPLTRSLALDMERRGYIVYITVSSTEEDSLVHSEAKPDIRPLWIDLTSTVPNPTVDIHPNLDPIRELIITSSRSSSPGSHRSPASATAQNLTLAGIVVLPGSLGYPTGPLATIPPSDLIDIINTRLLAPVLTTQQFLPLLANYTTDPKLSPSIIIAFPSITNSLHPPNYIPEALITASLASLASCLRREIRAAGAPIRLTELKLGNFDLNQAQNSDWNTSSALTTTIKSPPQSSQQQQHWHSSQRAPAPRSRPASQPQLSAHRGSATREFHNAVFDALAPPQTFKAFGTFEWSAGRSNSIVYVGSGARLYSVVGRWMPSGLVGRMLGFGCSSTGRSRVRASVPGSNGGEGRVLGGREWVLGGENGAQNASRSSSLEASMFGSRADNGQDEGSQVWEKVYG